MSDVGVTTKLGTCSQAGPRLTIPAPYFTTRTTLPNGQHVADSTPNQCQPFDIVWSTCNAGTSTTSQVNYTVRLQDQVPPGVVGLDQGIVFTAPALAPCACDPKSIVSATGFHCNEPAFTPTRTVISSSLTTATGSFTVGF